MHPELERLGFAFGEIWAAHCERPLAEVRFAFDPGPGKLGTMQYRPELAGVRMIIKRADFDSMLEVALHELAHGCYGPGTSEAACDKFADIYMPLWRDPALAYVRGDPEPVNDIVKAMAWSRKQAQKARRKASTDARRFADVCKKHGVIALDWKPGTCSPWVEFAPNASKSVDLEVEAMIKRLGITDPAMLRFVRSVLTRRQRYIRWVRDLIASGLINAGLTSATA